MHTIISVKILLLTNISFPDHKMIVAEIEIRNVEREDSNKSNTVDLSEEDSVVGESKDSKHQIDVELENMVSIATYRTYPWGY